MVTKTKPVCQLYLLCYIIVQKGNYKCADRFSVISVMATTTLQNLQTIRKFLSLDKYNDIRRGVDL